VEAEADAESESLLEPGRLGVQTYTTLERLGDGRLHSEFSEEDRDACENRGGDADDDDDENGGGRQEALGRSTRARNRWFLFYTLIKNPQLRYFSPVFFFSMEALRQPIPSNTDRLAGRSGDVQTTVRSKLL